MNWKGDLVSFNPIANRHESFIYTHTALLTTSHRRIGFLSNFGEGRKCCRCCYSTGGAHSPNTLHFSSSRSGGGPVHFKFGRPLYYIYNYHIFVQIPSKLYLKCCVNTRKSQFLCVVRQSGIFCDYIYPR